jgi:hypothetical protein
MVLCFIFWGTSILVSIGGCNILHSYKQCIRVPYLLNHCRKFVVFLLDDCHSDRGMMESQCCFDFPLWLRMWALLHVFFFLLYFFYKLCVQIVCSFINWVICSFGVYFFEPFLYFGYCAMSSLQRFPPILWVLFMLITVCFDVQNSNLMPFHVSIFTSISQMES